MKVKTQEGVPEILDGKLEIIIKDNGTFEFVARVKDKAGTWKVNTDVIDTGDIDAWEIR